MRLAVDRLDRAQLADAAAGRADAGDQRMPAAAEGADQRPDLVRRRGEIDAFDHALQLCVRRGQVGEGFGARLGRAGGAALQELAVAIDHPGQQDVDDVGIDRAPAAGGVRLARSSVLFRSRGGWCRVIGLATSISRKSSRNTLALAASACGVQSALPSRRSQFSKLSLQPLEEQGLQRFRHRERRLLVPQVAQVVGAGQRRVVEPHVGLLGAADPVDARHRVADEATGPRDRHRLGDHAEQRALARVRARGACRTR